MQLFWLFYRYVEVIRRFIPPKNPLIIYYIYSMKNKKAIVDIYHCEMYNVYLVVANRYATLEQLKKKYTYSNGEELDDFILNGIATTVTCTDRKTNNKVILVKYNHDNTSKSVNKRTDFVNTVSHEATHVALDVFCCIINQKISTDCSEPFCYLQGWAAECIYKTWTK